MLPNLQPGEMLVILLVGVLLFGKKLPEVGRSLGKGIVEFKKGLRGFDDDHEAETASKSSYRSDSTPTDEAGMVSIPKFEPPTSAPTLQTGTESPVQG